MVNQAALKLAHDLTEDSGGEESRPERAGSALTDGRQPREDGSDLREHEFELLSDLRRSRGVELLSDLRRGRVCSVGRREASGPRCICCGTQGMRSHMGNRGRRLPRA